MFQFIFFRSTSMYSWKWMEIFQTVRIIGKVVKKQYDGFLLRLSSTYNWFKEEKNHIFNLILYKSRVHHTVWPEPIWIKVKKVLYSTTTAWKYITKRPRICINWNPPFRRSIHKIFKNCFLLSIFIFTIFTFRGTFGK